LRGVGVVGSAREGERERKEEREERERRRRKREKGLVSGNGEGGLSGREL